MKIYLWAPVHRVLKAVRGLGQIAGCEWGRDHPPSPPEKGVVINVEVTESVHLRHCGKNHGVVDGSPSERRGQ